MSKTFRGVFVKITVHDNRIEVREGMIPFVKTTTIPFRNISSVKVGRFTRRLVVETNDGDNYQYTMGFIFGGRKAERTRQAIVELL